MPDRATGAISRALKTQLRIHARAAYPDQPQAARLKDYRTGRGTATGPVGENVGEICDQTDRADVMLTGLRDHARHAPRPRRQARPQADGPR